MAVRTKGRSITPTGRRRGRPPGSKNKTTTTARPVVPRSSTSAVALSAPVATIQKVAAIVRENETLKEQIASYETLIAGLNVALGVKKRGRRSKAEAVALQAIASETPTVPAPEGEEESDDDSSDEGGADDEKGE